MLEFGEGNLGGSPCEIATLSFLPSGVSQDKL